MSAAGVGMISLCNLTVLEGADSRQLWQQYSVTADVAGGEI